MILSNQMKRLAIIVAILAVLGASVGVFALKSQTPLSTPVKAVKQAPSKPAVHQLSPSDIDINQLSTLINKDRTDSGIAPLQIDNRLNTSASAKCADMVARNYWGHDSPIGVTPDDFILNQGLPRIHLGENLAEGYKTAMSVNTGWLNSPEHKRNILDPDYTNVGYAVCKSDKYIGRNNLPSLIVVQHFAEL